MIEKEFVCIVCPVGCNLRVRKEGEELIVTGNTCPRGEKYGKQEMIAPKRTICSTVRVKNGFLPLVSVKTSDEIPKEKIFDVMNVINKIEIKAPVELGQIIVENILDTGVNIVATRDVDNMKKLRD